MKKLLMLCFAVLAITFVDADAITKKKMIGKQIKVPGTQKIKKENSSRRFFRGLGNGTGSKERSAKMKAEMEAKRLISEQIKQLIQTTSESYMKDTEVGDASVFESSLENMVVVSTKNSLSNVVISGYEMYYVKKKGMYNAYVVLEVKRDDVEKAMMNAISKNQQLQVDFDKAKFREKFDAEMTKFGDENIVE